MPINPERKKQFRTIGHKLNPIVTIAGNGLSAGVLAELNRALDDHELIKVKLAIAERDERKEVVAELVALPNVELVPGDWQSSYYSIATIKEPTPSFPMCSAKS